MEITHSLDYSVSFGDCDPAGIVFYPNVYAWFDRTFHEWLWQFGGHEALCQRLEALGLGLMEASAQFRRPMRNGDLLSLTLSVEEWGRKTLQLAYEGRVGGQLAVVGTEVRGLFKLGDTGMVAAEIEALRGIVEANGQR
ncbi:acyl-CoA thioesterase [Chelativorans salis]|uniref:Acyl-CoA thioesterase n=1 Tax=Chelativorans salis TaxID=2978478 RepID=A0ABT2LLC7_9HYPH|nr:acyl-CoA thioesterase [Chelativorans sp. EGI FJ00035]MCT7374622.1 acyl-CoA thioesterase [Chelativorans sp. EGI FJ00035]